MYIYSNNNGTGISLFHLRMITIFTKVHTSLSSEFPHICIKSFQFPLSTLAHTQTFDTQIPKPWILYRLSESHTTIIIWNGRLWPNSCCFFLSSTHRNYLAQLLCLLNSIVDRDRILEDHRGQLCVCRFCSCSQISIPILKYGSHVCKCFRICVTDYVLFSVWSYVRKPTSPDRSDRLLMRSLASNHHHHRKATAQSQPAQLGLGEWVLSRKDAPSRTGLRNSNRERHETRVRRRIVEELYIVCARCAKQEALCVVALNTR